MTRTPVAIPRPRRRERAITTPSITEFVTDPALLGLSLSRWQDTLLRTIYGAPLDSERLDIFRAGTGRERYLGQPFSEATIIAGARAGKDSRIAAPIVVYEAVFGNHEHHLARGERGTVPLVAQDARGAKIAFGYIRDYLTKSPLLASRVNDVLASEITLANGLTIATFPCTLKSLRGWSIPVAILDEVGFYRLEGQADSDVEIQASVRRGMIAFPSTRLVKISTPYMKSGILFDDFKRGFGVDDPDLLVWRASSALMNPALTPERLERERRLDPTRFAREYLGEFAEDLDVFLPAAWIESAIQRGRHEVPPQPGVRYVAAVDASGGGPDAFTVAIVHGEGQGAARRLVHDVARGWRKPRDGATDLEGAVQQIAALVRSYGVTSVVGDRYARGWVREAFKRHAIVYDDATVRGPDGVPVYLDKSAAYLEVEPLFATGAIALLDHPTLERELRNLERRPSPGGKDRIDHPSGQHDDFANALCLAAAKARQGSIRPMITIPAGIGRIGERSVGRVGAGQAAHAQRGVAAGQAAHVLRHYTPHWHRGG